VAAPTCLAPRHLVVALARRLEIPASDHVFEATLSFVDVDQVGDDSYERLSAHCEAVLKFVRILLEAFPTAPVEYHGGPSRCPECCSPGSVHMTASSSYSGTVDNFWSRDDIRVHTCAGTPNAVEVLAEGSVRGQADPHRRHEASRSGSGARQPVSAGDLLGVRRLSRLGAMARIRTPRRARHGTPHPHVH